MKWWGKQYLGKAEKNGNTNSRPSGGPIVIGGLKVHAITTKFWEANHEPPPLEAPE
jgi:hypothetical protein